MNGPAQPIERRAEALDELRRLYDEHAQMEAVIAEQRRSIERLEDRVTLLDGALAESRQEERVATRKLVRLATAMQTMGQLAKNADEIMKSVQDWEDEIPIEGNTASQIVEQINGLHENQKGDQDGQ